MSDEEKLAIAILLFYRVGPWTDEHRAIWKEITGEFDATTRVLAGLARNILAAKQVSYFLNGEISLEKLLDNFNKFLREEEENVL